MGFNGVFQTPYPALGFCNIDQGEERAIYCTNYCLLCHQSDLDKAIEDRLLKFVEAAKLKGMADNIRSQKINGKL